MKCPDCGNKAKKMKDKDGWHAQGEYMCQTCSWCFVPYGNVVYPRITVPEGWEPPDMYAKPVEDHDV